MARRTFTYVVITLIVFASCKKKYQNHSPEDVEKQEILNILNIMKAQEKAWSQHDLEGFMKGYWRSNELKFYGSGGVTSGWKETLSNYKKRYPSKEHTGKLTFTIKDISKINNGAYFVMGGYHLKRKVGDANGIFMVIFKKIKKGKWKIIADTSCSS